MKRILIHLCFLLVFSAPTLAQNSDDALEKFIGSIQFGEMNDRELVSILTQSFKLMTDTLKSKDADNLQMLETLKSSVALSTEFAARNEELIERIRKLEQENEALRQTLEKASVRSDEFGANKTPSSGLVLKTWAGVDGEITTKPVELPEPRDGFVVHWAFRGSDPSSAIYIHVYDSRDNRPISSFRGTGTDQNLGYVSSSLPSCYLKISASGEYRVWIEVL